MRLSGLKIGQSAVVFADNSYTKQAMRLADLGLTPGAPVSLIRKSSFGHTLHIEVRNTSICLSQKDADQFLVEPLKL